MRLTKQTSYALRILIHCAVSGEKHVKAAEIAAEHGITEFNVAKIVPILVRGGFIATSRGRTGGLKLARPPEEGLLGAMREVMRCELDAQLDDPRVKREFQVMLTTPSLRNLAREHFYEEEAEMVPAIAARLGVAPDSLVVHVVTGMITSAIWATVNRWLAEGPELELGRLNEMMDETFALLGDGVDRAVEATRD